MSMALSSISIKSDDNVHRGINFTVRQWLLELPTLEIRSCHWQSTFVGDDLVDLDTTGSSNDELGLGVVDALLDLQRSESSENDLCGGGIKIMCMDNENSWSGIACMTVQSPPHCSFDIPTYTVGNAETGTCKHRNQGLGNHGHYLKQKMWGRKI